MYGSPGVNAVLLTAHAVGLDYKFQLVDLLKRENKTPEYAKLNPQQTIPTFDDNGKIICDSHAMLPYIVGKYGADDSLYPKDLYQRALVDQRLHFDNGILYPRMDLCFADIFKTKGDVSEGSKKLILDAFDTLEKFLELSPYVAGNTLTVADFSCASNFCAVQPLFPIDSEKYPKITAWLTRLFEIPYFVEINDKSTKVILEFLSMIRK